MCDAYCIVEWICILIVLIAVPVYVILLAMLIKFRNKSDFKSSFYRLIVSCGVADLWWIVHYYFLSRFPTWGWFLWIYRAGNGYLARYYLMTNWYLRHSQAMGVLIISVNRFTALIWPTKYETMWRAKRVRQALVVQWLVPLLTVGHMFVVCDFYYLPENNGTTLSGSSGRCPPQCLCRKVTWGISTSFLFVVVSLLIFMYSAMFIKYWRHRNKTQPTTTTKATAMEQARQRKKQRTQVKLAINGFVIALTLIMFGLFYGFKTLNTSFATYNPVLNGIISYVLFFLYSLINPFVLLALSSKVRTFFFLVCKMMVGIKVHDYEINLAAAIQQPRAGGGSSEAASSAVA